MRSATGRVDFGLGEGEGREFDRPGGFFGFIAGDEAAVVGGGGFEMVEDAD
jgi:hypothetical protein